MKLRERPVGNMREREEGVRSRCGATAPDVKTKQGITRENKLGRIGKDEVPSSNLGSSSSAGPWNLSDSRGFDMRGGKVLPYFFPYWPETRLMKDSIRAALACFI